MMRHGCVLPGGTRSQSRAQGMPLTGVLPRSGYFEPVEGGPCRDVSDLRNNAERINKRIIERMSAPEKGSPEVSQILHEKSMDEVSSGSGKLIPLSNLRNGDLLVPRFAVDEGWRYKQGEWRRKERRHVAVEPASGRACAGETD